MKSSERALAGIIRARAARSRSSARLRHPFALRCDRACLGFATGKRAEEALAATMTVKENLFLNPVNFGHSAFRIRSRAKERRDAGVILKKFDVRPPIPSATSPP